MTTYTVVSNPQSQKKLITTYAKHEYISHIYNNHSSILIIPVIVIRRYPMNININDQKYTLILFEINETCQEIHCSCR